MINTCSTIGGSTLYGSLLFTIAFKWKTTILMCESTCTSTLKVFIWSHILKGFIMMPYFIHETCSKPRLQVTIKVCQGMNPTTNIKPKIHTLPNLDKFSSHVLAWTTLIIIHIAHKLFMLGAQSYKCLFIWYELTCVWEKTFLQVNNSIWILCAKWK
jgi:hypothetical protein